MYTDLFFLLFFNRISFIVIIVTENAWNTDTYWTLNKSHPNCYNAKTSIGSKEVKFTMWLARYQLLKPIDVCKQSHVSTYRENKEVMQLAATLAVNLRRLMMLFQR